MSTDRRLLWNAPPFPTRQLRPGEPLWSMRVGHRQMSAEPRGHGEYGWEIQFLRDGEFWAGHRFNLRAEAIAHGEEMRQDLFARGWR